MSDRTPHTSQNAPHATERGERAEKQALGVRTPERAPEGRTDARAVLDAAMSEAEYQSLILEYARTLGYRCHHQLVPFRRGKDGRVRAIVEPHTDKGFPDLVLARGGTTLYLEVKAARGKLSADQEAWGDALLMAGCDWRVVRPSDWPEIEALLKGE